MRLSPIAALLFLAGCAANVVQPVGPKPKDDLVVMHGDTSFSASERSCVESAAAQWAEQTHGVASIKVYWDLDSKSPASILEHKEDKTLVRWTSKTPKVRDQDISSQEDCAETFANSPELKETCKSVRLLGMVSGFPKEMGLVMDRLSDHGFCKQVAMHEFGHVMGLPHLTGSYENIMFPAADRSRSSCLKEEDLLAFCYLNKCGNVEMSPCKE